MGVIGKTVSREIQSRRGNEMDKDLWATEVWITANSLNCAVGKRGRRVPDGKARILCKNSGKVLAAILIEMERNDPVSSGHGCCLVKDK